MREPSIPGAVVAGPQMQEGRAGYLGSVLRNRRTSPEELRAHRPQSRQTYPDTLADDRAAALVAFLRAHDSPRHWKDGEHKPCWCRECWWARWERDAAGRLPAELVVEREQSSVADAAGSSC